eukprot:2201407-Rhodomonas_salina.5
MGGRIRSLVRRCASATLSRKRVSNGALFTPNSTCNSSKDASLGFDLWPSKSREHEQSVGCALSSEASKVVEHLAVLGAPSLPCPVHHLLPTPLPTLARSLSHPHLTLSLPSKHISSPHRHADCQIKHQCKPSEATDRLSGCEDAGGLDVDAEHLAVEQIWPQQVRDRRRIVHLTPPDRVNRGHSQHLHQAGDSRRART